MSTVFNALFGLLLVGMGAWRRRPTALRCGAALIAFALLDALMIYLALRGGRSIPAIGLHAVFLFPVAIWLAWKGARDLRPQAPASTGRR